MEILDIIVFDSKGKQIVSKSQVLNENSIAIGFLPLINLYMSKISTINFPSLILEKHKILFQHMRGIIGAIILNSLENDVALDFENEDQALDLLKNLLRNLLFNGIEKADQVMEAFIKEKMKK